MKWTLEPTQKEWINSTIHLWETEDKSFQVLRIVSPGEKTIFGAQKKTSSGYYIFEHNPKMGAGYPKYYYSLEEVLTSIEQHSKDVITNKEEVIAHAHRLGLDGNRKTTAKTISKIESSDNKEEEPTPKRQSNNNNKMNCLDAAYTVLSEENKPMTPKELIVLMEKRGYWKSPGGATPERTLGSAIGVEISKKKDKSRFKKESRGYFTLNN